MTDDNDSSDDYRVGKGRPPRASQFKRGQVANPYGRRGRAGGSRRNPTMAEEQGRILRRVLNTKVEVNTAKGKSKLTKWEVAINQLVHRAMKGDPSAMRELRRYQVEFPDLASPPIRVTKIEHEIIPVNPFTTEQATIEKFREAFPDAPDDHIAVMRHYFDEDRSR